MEMLPTDDQEPPRAKLLRHFFNSPHKDSPSVYRVGNPCGHLIRPENTNHGDHP